MRSLKIVGVVALAGIVGVTLFLGMPLLGSNVGVSHANGGGAVVIHKDGGCNLFDADGTLFFDPNGIQNRVLTPSGNSKITCQSQLPAGATVPKKAVRWDNSNTGKLCSTGWGLTQDWKNVVTPSGQVTLTCRINHNK